MMQEFPYYTVSAAHDTEYETGWSVELRLSDHAIPLPGVSEQDIVDALAAYFNTLPNVTVRVDKTEVVSTQL
ncbi:hypothetical protein [Actinacidiphila glaucinigra]|uniref:hypothetical protein n=1 Tax=Actinacidiphila glaucinigra TaxID=235986 RepID=UPI0035D7A0D0